MSSTKPQVHNVMPWSHVTHTANLACLLHQVPSCESDVLSTVAGKLLGRTQKIAFNLLHKVGPKGDPGIKPGDRVCWCQMFLCSVHSDIQLYSLQQHNMHWIQAAKSLTV